MAAYQKFEQFVEDVCYAVHDLETDALELALTNAANAPNLATDVLLGTLTQIAYTWLSSLVLTTTINTQTGGVFTLQLNDITISASGGTAAGFRYIVVFNQTTTVKTDPLICMFDYGSDLVLADGESLTVDFESDGGTTGDLFTLT